MDVAVKLFKAIRANKIDVPVMHYDELEDGGIRLYLYGGRILEWVPEESSREAARDAKEIVPIPSEAAIQIAERAPSETPEGISPKAPAGEQPKAAKRKRGATPTTAKNAVVSPSPSQSMEKGRKRKSEK